MIPLFLSSLFGFILIGVPVAFALFLTALVLSWFMGSWSPALVVQTVFRGIDNFPLMAIPFFLLAGEIMNTGGIAQRIIMVAKAMFGHVRGGLGYVTVVASMLISGVSGSAVADASAIGSLLYPVMKKEGYDPEKAAALFAAATTNGPIIPPSIPMVVFGVIANVSIIRLFIGGIIPGLILGVGLMIGWWLHVRGKKRYHVEGKFSTDRRHQGLLGGLLGAVAAGHHPGRDPARHLHGHRGRRGLGRLRLHRLGLHLPRTQGEGLPPGPGQHGAGGRRSFFWSAARPWPRPTSSPRPRSRR